MKNSLFALVLLSLLSCSVAEARRTGPLRKQTVNMVVIHSTGGPTCDANGKPIWVSAGTMQDNIRTIEAHPVLGIHYMIDRDGSQRASVPEDRIAHHVFAYSERSIAIELINDGDGKDPFSEPQVQALVNLLQSLVKRYGLQRNQIKRHSDLDLGYMPCNPKQRRKVDPGPALAFDQVLDRVFGVSR
jgi:N-acetylmuramoyl-L-alanine amidase